MKIFVTGGAGFIGSNYARWVLRNTDHSVTVYDSLTYAGNLSTLRDMDDSPRFSFVKGNICHPGDIEAAMKGHDWVVHFAAESHVDRSIESGEDFILTNCFGTNVVIDTARKLGMQRVVHIGTDEVYGSVEVGSSKETDPECDLRRCSWRGFPRASRDSAAAAAVAHARIATSPADWRVRQ